MREMSNNKREGECLIPGKDKVTANTLSVAISLWNNLNKYMKDVKEEFLRVFFFFKELSENILPFPKSLLHPSFLQCHICISCVSQNIQRRGYNVARRAGF